MEGPRSAVSRVGAGTVKSVKQATLMILPSDFSYSELEDLGR